MTLDTNNQKGSLELRSGTQDSIQGPISEAYVQHWFQEEFLRLFYEDPEFREQVLKCLLTGENDDGTAQVRKPRRTWFDGIGETQEISCEEARYLHICGENTCTESDLSSEVAEERCDVAMKKNFAGQGQARAEASGQLGTAGILELVAKVMLPSKMFGAKDGDTNQSGIHFGDNSNANKNLSGDPESPEDRPESPSPSAVTSEGHPKNLEESSTGPRQHERGTQTWKANPLYLVGNSDSDSNDSWQHEGSNVAWMDDLENGKMLQEVKMRKVKRLEDSRPLQNADGYENWKDHSKSCPQGYFSSVIQGIPQYFAENSLQAAHSQGKKSFNDERTGHLSNGNTFQASSKLICARPEEKLDIAVTPCTDKNCKGNVQFGKDKSTDLFSSCDCGDPAASPFVSVHREVAEDLSVEVRRFSQDLGLKPQVQVLSQDMPVVFFREEEKTLFNKHSLPVVSYVVNSKQDGKAILFPAPISGTQNLDMNDNEKPKTSSKIISPVERRLKVDEELSDPTSKISNPALLADEINGNHEKDVQTVSYGRSVQLSHLDVQFVSLSENISLPSSCTADESEGKFPSESIGMSTQTLREVELSIFEGRPHSFSSLSRSDNEKVIPGELSEDERTQSLHQEIEPCSAEHSKTILDEEERLSAPSSSQASTSGSITGKEPTRAANICESMMSKEKISTQSSPRILRAPHLQAIHEEELGVGATKSLPGSVLIPVVTRAAFKPAKDIHWLPPKRNIQFMGIQTPSAHRPLGNVQKASIKWDLACDRPQAKAHNLALEDAKGREQKSRKETSRSHRNRIQLWASLLSKLFKRTILIRWEFNRKKPDQEYCS